MGDQRELLDRGLLCLPQLIEVTSGVLGELGHGVAVGGDDLSALALADPELLGDRAVAGARRMREEDLRVAPLSVAGLHAFIVAQETGPSTSGGPEANLRRTRLRRKAGGSGTCVPRS